MEALIVSMTFAGSLLALLFAVYKTRTVPFYVFDEVEAALDDSNLSKLLDAIEQLKETTQLIVISHQRRTMEQADVLFFSDENLPCPAEDFIRRLRDRYHNRILVLGRGAEGAMLLEGETGELTRIPAWTGGPVVNTVGAGDSYIAGFTYGLSLGESVPQCMARGKAQATKIIQSFNPYE